MTRDNGWGAPVARGPVTAAPSDRERLRAEDRERRARERLAAAEARTERRVVDRDTQSKDREAAREALRQEEDARRAARITEREDRPKRRATGSLARTGDKPVERDTRHYATTLDGDRIRLLAGRGATPAALATVFGVSEAVIADVLGKVEGSVTN